MIYKCWLVGICLAVLVVVVAYSLIDFSSTDEGDDVPDAQAQNESLSPPAINRKTPSALRRKMLEVSTVERPVGEAALLPLSVCVIRKILFVGGSPFFEAWKSPHP